MYPLPPIKGVSTRQVIIASSVILALSLGPIRSLLLDVITIWGVVSLCLLLGLYFALSALLRADKRETHPYRALRPLAITTPSAWSAILIRQSWEEDPTAIRGPTSLTSAPLTVRTALDRVLHLVQRHFILPWYSRISPSAAFPHSTDTLIRHVVVNALSQGQNIDWASLLVSRIVPIVRDHLQHYRSVEHLAPSSSTTEKTALPLPLPHRPHPALGSTDHSVSAGTSPLIEVHLRSQVETILSHVLPETDQSEVVKVLVREVVLGAVLMPVFDMLCDSDFWNRQIDDRGGRYLHEQFLSALSTIPDTPSTTVTPVKSKTSYPPQTAFISANSSTQQFEAFIRSISRLKTLGEARRLRADIERELRVARGKLEQEQTDQLLEKGDERLLKRNKKYIQRLERASNQVEARIAVLSGPHAKPDLLRSPQSAFNVPSSGPDISLHTVLLDPSSLAYWLEFMERRGRSKLVQFWLTVEGFKDPLESADPAMPSFSSLSAANDAIKPYSTILDDVTFLYEMYFTSVTDIGVDSRDINSMKNFIDQNRGPKSMTSQTVQAAKQAMFNAQRSVYEQMQEADWTEFERSELFRKVIQDLARHESVPSPRETSFFSPRSVTSPVVPPAPPVKPARHVSSPMLETRSSKRQIVRAGPTLINGNFTPATTVTPSASVSTTPPTFSRGVSQIRPPIPDRDTGEMDKSRSSIDLPRVIAPARPSTPPRLTSHLDVLMTGDQGIHPEVDRRIFGDDDPDDQVDDDDFVQIQRMEAIQAALSEIIASDDMTASHAETRQSPTPEAGQSLSASLVLSPVSERTEAPYRQVSRSVDDLKTIPVSNKVDGRLPTVKNEPIPLSPTMEQPDSLLSTATSPLKSPTLMDRSKLFDDGSDETAPNGADDINGDAEFVQLAAPGNLYLGSEIGRLGSKIQDLVKQENLLESLIRRADLTGNEAELKLLQKSISTIRRDLRSSVFQKAQYEQQEEENRLVPGRTTVSIPSAHVTADESEGKQVARYAVRISQMREGHEENAIAGSWFVYRRYNQFFELDRAIREWGSASSDKDLGRDVRNLVELPGKKLGPSTSAGLMEARRLGLERYLRALLSNQRFCNSPILRDFLSRSPSLSQTSGQLASISSLAPHNIVRSLYKTVTTTLDDTPLGPSMFDMIQSTLNRQFSDVAGGLGEVVELGGELFGYGSSFLPPALRGVGGNGLAASPVIPDRDTAGAPKVVPTGPGMIGGETGSTTFTAPICDLFLEVFDLDESNWLRRQAIVVILQQFLGSTIERKVKDTLRGLATPDMAEKWLVSFTDTLFPEGERRPPSDERTEAEKLATRQRASRKLALLIPDLAANMIGRSNARRAARRVFGVLQDRRLNQYLVLKILDEIIGAMFPSPKHKVKV